MRKRLERVHPGAHRGNFNEVIPMAVIIEWLKIILPCLVTGLITFIFTAKQKRDKNAEEIMKRQKESKDEILGIIDANNKGTLALLRQHLIDAYILYVVDTYPMTLERKRSVEQMYDAYKLLGGNGTIDDMYNEIMNIHPHVLNTSSGEIVGGVDIDKFVASDRRNEERKNGQ